jgi:hypothetical protein
VLITPKRPTDENEGFVEVGFGNYANREGGGAFNWAAIPDQLRFRFSGQIREREGFTTQRSDGRDLDDINYYTLRASMLFNPTENFENYTTAQFTRSATGGTGIVIAAANPNFGTVPVVAGLVAPYLAAQPVLGIRDTQGGAEHWWLSKTLMVVNNSTLELPYNLTLKNIASFSRVRVSGGFDNDGTPLNITGFERTPYSGQPSGFGEGRNEFITEELQLQGKWLDGDFNWVLGGGADENQQLDQNRLGAELNDQRRLRARHPRFRRADRCTGWPETHARLPLHVGHARLSGVVVSGFADASELHQRIGAGLSELRQAPARRMVGADLHGRSRLQADRQGSGLCGLPHRLQERRHQHGHQRGDPAILRARKGQEH